VFNDIQMIDTAFAFRYFNTLMMRTRKTLKLMNSMNALPALLCAALTILSLQASARADDWPAWRGADRTGISKETGWNQKWPAEGLKRLWEAGSSGKLESGMRI